MAKITIIGAGVPRPAQERFGTSFVLEYKDEYLLFDCGPATTYKLVKAGLWPTQVSHLFLPITIPTIMQIIRVLSCAAGIKVSERRMPSASMALLRPKQ